MTSAVSAGLALVPPSPIRQQWRRLATAIPANERDEGNREINAAAYEAALIELGRRREEPLSVYLHLPFCPVRCLYCGCNTIITHSTDRIDQYLDSLEHEMDLVLEKIGSGRELLQLHIGGGTPNYLNDAQLVRLMAMIGQRFRVLGETETSIECNPRKASAGQLSLLRGVGFRRISFGVQDLQPDVQKAIGRINSTELVRDVCAMTREAGFEYINLDLIYGLPYQTVTTFEDTVDAVIDMGPDRVSCFPYFHTPIHKPHQHALDTERLPSRSERLRLFRHAVRRFTDSGYTWVGLDSFVLDTDELAIAQDEQRLYRNCIGYTGTPSPYLVSFGMGAVSDVSATLAQNALQLHEWLGAVREDRLPIAFSHCLDPGQRLRRQAVMRLICNLRIPKDLAKTAMPSVYARLDRYCADGLATEEAHAISLTQRGRYYVHTLCADPGAHLQEDRAFWPLLQSI